MFNRRKLFGFVAAAPVVAFLPNTDVKAEVSKKEDTSHNAPNGTCILQLQAQEMSKPKSMSYGSSSSFTLSSYQPVGPKLGISVGKDGHMWVKIHNEWKRVVVE